MLKKISILFGVLFLANNAYAATRADAARLNPVDAVNSVTLQSENTAVATQSARSARRAPSNRMPVQVQQNQPPTTPNILTRGVATRSATTPLTTTPVGRSAIPTLASRAAKQNVISTGTKVAAATDNTVVDQECWNGFMGCMDSFCMLDNANGGRCICSDKNAEYDTILEEIQKLDEQSYQLATVGVEQIEMGEAADAVMARTKDVTKNVEKDTKATQSKRKSLDLSQWTSTGAIDFDADVEDIFSLSSDGISIDNKTGDALYRAAARLCKAQLPNCENQSTMMELMYKQRVRSDCTAYENSLRQQRTQSAQKLAAAQSAMREAALEQYQNANKYDLGQCTVQFKQCMQTTGGCGEDFTGCVDLAARAEASRAASTTGHAAKQKTIQGTTSKITIAASTYDTLLAKQPLCMTVTNQCVNVRNQVWDTFIREVAPQIKAAELIAESNLRSSCISNISNCFQKACKDTMDPNDPEGSYDMCLTRPQALESLCRVEIEPCKSAEPKIMDYVVARLASMRVDACTREFKECLTSEDRCGSDYTQCVGLDTGTIVEMCPAEKLVGCQYDYDDSYGATYGDGSDSGGKKKRVKTNDEINTELHTIAQGIFLNIDNNMLAACQKTVQNKVIEVCGDLTFCDAFEDDEVIGTDSLTKRKKTNGDTVISGLMNFGLIEIDTTNNTLKTDEYRLIYKQTTGQGHSTQTNYISTTMGTRKDQTDLTPVELQILSALNTVKNKAEQKIAQISNDEKVKQCIDGRGDKWKGGDTDALTGNGRFPNLLDTYNLMILNSALDKAYQNYNTKYNSMVAEALKDQSDDIKQMTCAAMTWDTDKNNDLGTLLEQVFVGDSTYTGTEYTISGAKLKTKLQVMSQTGTKYVVEDQNGNMLARVEKTSSFSPTTGVCTIITSTTVCKDVAEIMEEHKEKDTDVGIAGIVGSVNNHVVEWEEFKGTYCNEYAPTDTTKEEIQM